MQMRQEWVGCYWGNRPVPASFRGCSESRERPGRYAAPPGVRARLRSLPSTSHSRVPLLTWAFRFFFAGWFTKRVFGPPRKGPGVRFLPGFAPVFSFNWLWGLEYTFWPGLRRSLLFLYVRRCFLVLAGPWPVCFFCFFFAPLCPIVPIINEPLRLCLKSFICKNGPQRNTTRFSNWSFVSLRSAFNHVLASQDFTERERCWHTGSRCGNFASWAALFHGSLHAGGVQIARQRRIFQSIQ